MPLVLDGSGGISGVDGTASNPAIEGTDSNTGIFYPAADTVAIGTGGTEALRVNSSQNVGIGTSSPSNKLHVNGVTRISGVSAGSTALFIPAGDIVGDVSSGSMAIGNLGDSSSETRITTRGFTTFRTGATDGTNGTERMRLDASGNLVVGATSTSSRFEAVSGTGAQFIGTFRTGDSTAANNAGGGFYAISSGTAASREAVLWLDADGANLSGGDYFWIRKLGNNGNVEIIQQSNAAMTFQTNGTERARITSDGYFKASNLGTYYGSGQPYHELRNSASSLGVAVTETNNSYANEVIRTLVARFQTSAYQFFMAYSNDGSDLEFNLRGDGNGYADGTWNNNGADYAEFFESATGAALTLGATVVLDGNKVREATDQDPASAIMGVVRPKEPSKASMVVGNTAWNKWANKYLTDDFDRYIMEDHDVLEWTDEEGNLKTYESHNIPAGVTVPDDAVVKTHDDKGNKFQHYKLNPAWNPDAEYVNRENRPEWIIVGLVGQVKILKGQPVNDRWIKMRDVSATVEEWMIR